MKIPKHQNFYLTHCKSKLTTGGWHGITLTNCFADKDPKRKEIIKYLKEIF